MQRSLQKSFVDALITAADKGQGLKLNKNLAEKYEHHPLLDDATKRCICCEESMVQRGLSSAPRTLKLSSGQVDRTGDAISIKRGEMIKILNLLKKKVKSANRETELHYLDLINRIQDALDLPKN